MKPADFVHSHIRSLHGYVPGIQPKDPDVIKLNTNENPFPVSDAVRRALIAEIDAQSLQKYPDPVSQKLRDALSAKYGRPSECFLIGNGSDEILSILFRAVLGPDAGMVTALPTYSLYPVIAALTQAPCLEVQVRSDWHIDFDAMLANMQDAYGIRRTLCAFANPNAPTGLCEPEKTVLDFAKANPGLTLVDEAYADFDRVSLFRFAGTADYPRLLVSGTASKALSLAGGRIGWLCGDPAFIAQLEKLKDSYNVSRLAQAAALAAVLDSGEQQSRIAQIIKSREALTQDLAGLGFQTLPSSANFIFTKPPAGLAAAESSAAGEYYAKLLAEKILVRYWNTPLLREFVRITIGTEDQMARLIAVTRALTASSR